MRQDDLIAIAIMAILGNAPLLFIIFSEAVKAKRRDKYLLIQARLLAEIAKKQGVDPEVINQITK